MIGNGLDDALSRHHDEDEAKKIQPRYVRNEKGQFLSNTPAAPFGVPRYIDDVEKSWAGNLGGKVGGAAARRGQSMKTRAFTDTIASPKGAGRNKRRYLRGAKLVDVGDAINSSGTTREATGYAVTAMGVGAAAGAGTGLRNRSKKRS